MGTSQQDVHDKEEQKRQRTNQMDYGGHSSTDVHQLGSSHRQPKSCGSKIEDKRNVYHKLTLQYCSE